MKQKPVEVGSFVTVNDTSYAQYGVKKNDIIYLAGDAIVSVSEEDPYALRRIFVATHVIDGHIQATNATPFTIDGKRLTPVSKSKQEKLNAIREMDFKSEEETNETTH